MLNKCLKLFLVLLLVAALAVGVSLLPFSLSDKFKKVAETVKSHFKNLTNFGQEDGKIHLDLSKTDSYKYNDLNVVLDKVDNFPKEGFFKYVHKGEKDAPLYVEKFMNGEKKLDGLEPTLVDYCAGYYKTGIPHLLAVELLLHDKNKEPKKEENKNNKEDNKGGETKGGTDGAKGGDENAGGEPKSPAKNTKFVYVMGENNKWVKLREGTDLGLKLEEVVKKLTTNSNNGGDQPPTGGNTPSNGGQNPGNNNSTPPAGGAEAPVNGNSPNLSGENPKNTGGNNLGGTKGKGSAGDKGEKPDKDAPAHNNEEKEEKENNGTEGGEESVANGNGNTHPVGNNESSTESKGEGHQKPVEGEPTQEHPPETHKPSGENNGKNEGSANADGNHQGSVQDSVTPGDKKPESQGGSEVQQPNPPDRNVTGNA